MYTCMKHMDELSSTFYITCVTWVTFSETFCVRSLILLGAMISISAGEGGLRRSEPKDIVTWGMRPIARCRIKSESEVEFKLLGFKSEKENNQQNMHFSLQGLIKTMSCHVTCTTILRASANYNAIKVTVCVCNNEKVLI